MFKGHRGGSGGNIHLSPMGGGGPFLENTQRDTGRDMGGSRDVGRGDGADKKAGDRKGTRWGQWGGDAGRGHGVRLGDMGGWAVGTGRGVGTLRGGTKKDMMGV